MIANSKDQGEYLGAFIEINGKYYDESSLMLKEIRLLKIIRDNPGIMRYAMMEKFKEIYRDDFPSATISERLDSLEDKKLIERKVKDSKSKGRPPYMYFIKREEKTNENECSSNDILYS